MTKVDRLIEKICSIVDCTDDDSELLSRRSILRSQLEQLEKIFGDELEQIVDEILKKEECHYWFAIFDTIVNLKDKEPHYFIVNTLGDIIRKDVPIECLEIARLIKTKQKTFRELLHMLPNEYGACVNFVNINKKELFDIIPEIDLSNNKNSGSAYVNRILFVSKNNMECAVGIVRKMRDGVISDDNTCYTCPYFIPKDIIIEALKYIDEPDKHKDSLLEKIKERQRILYGDYDNIEDYLQLNIGGDEDA